MQTRPLVFISSTSDLSAERRALADELRPVYDLYLFEEDRARGSSPEERCRRQIERCDVFVGILGSRYGSAFPGSERSIVEWEFDTARAARDDLEIMPFVQRGAESGDDPRQKRFLERLTDFQGGLWCRWFDTSESLVLEARRSLEAWLLEFWSRMQRRQLESSVRLHRGVLAAVAVLVTLLLVVALTPLRSLVSTTALIALGVTVGVVALLGLVLLLAETTGSREVAE
jgi:hypothetical protein